MTKSFRSMASKRSVVRIVALTLLLLEPGQTKAGPIVDLALVLAVDVSPSIDARELRLQREGYAQALSSQEVIEVIQATGRVAVAYFEWSGAGKRRLIVPWTIIGSSVDAAQIAVLVKENRPRQFHGGNPFHYPDPFQGGTALGEAIAFAGDLMAIAPAARRKIIDVSGDGTNNDGMEPGPVRDRLVLSGITINGMPILSSVPTLADYYEQHVIGGALSFVLPVQNFEDFGRAVRAKLVTEVAGAGPARRFAEVP